MTADGIYALRELHTGKITHQELYCDPDVAEVPDGFQLIVKEDGEWIPYRQQTRADKLMDIRAFAERIIELVDEL